MSGAIINLLNVKTKVVRHTLTNSDGYFEIQNVEPGTYTLEVTTTGFKKNAIPPFPSMSIRPSPKTRFSPWVKLHDL